MCFSSTSSMPMPRSHPKQFLIPKPKNYAAAHLYLPHGPTPTCFVFDVVSGKRGPKMFIDCPTYLPP